MKNLTSKILIAVILITVISVTSFGQTSVSGGIYTNTTWIATNSPYIVTANVVVFPGVTLTIEPGVTVKFDNGTNMEIRQGTLIANGNAVDSITFTSNSTTPTPGIWGVSYYGGIWLNSALIATSFNFIKIEYATIGIYNALHIAGIKNSVFTNNLTGLASIYSSSIDSCIFKFNTSGMNTINNCSINFCTITNNTNGIGSLAHGSLINSVIDSNQTGIGGVSSVDGAKIINCSINYNQTGITSGQSLNGNKIQDCVIDYNSINGLAIYGDGPADTVINCEIKFNGIGFIASACPDMGTPGIVTQNIIESNTTGMKVSGCFNIYCNSICSNTGYNVENLGSFANNVSNNYWCTTDSMTIANSIYDGYDNASLGLIIFLPLDTLQCSPATGIADNIADLTLLNIYPNPFTDRLTVTINHQQIAEIIIYDIASRKLLQQEFTNSLALSTEQLTKGIYIYEVRNKSGMIKKGKIVKD